MTFKNKIFGGAGILLALGFLSQIPGAPTKIDLKTQSQNADFSSFPLLSIPTSTTLPGTCSVGQIFFLSTAIAGQNIYGCTSTNTWTLQAGAGGGGGGGSLVLPLPTTFISATQLNVGTGSARCGADPINFASTASITLNSGAGTSYIYIDCTNSQVLTVGYPASGMDVSCSGCTATSGITDFPAGSIPLSSWVASSGSWLSTGADVRTVLSGGFTISNGNNIGTTVTQTNVQVYYVSPPAVPFSSLPSCSTSEGLSLPIIDSSTNTWGGTISGSSTNHVLAYCDGTNWTVAAK